MKHLKTYEIITSTYPNIPTKFNIGNYVKVVVKNEFLKKEYEKEIYIISDIDKIGKIEYKLINARTGDWDWYKEKNIILAPEEEVAALKYNI